MNAIRRFSQLGQAALYGCGAAAAIGIIGIILILFSGANVQPGYVGVVADLNGINKDQQPLTQGFHPVMPFVTNIHAVSVQTQKHPFAKVTAGSKELQNVYIDGAVNYHLNPDAAAKIEINGGVEVVVARVFDPAFQDFIKEVVQPYPANEITANRATIREAVKVKLAAKGSQYGFTVDDLFITNIDFDGDYIKAIAAKQVAAQNLEKAKIEAATAVQTAQGVADAQVVAATADAKANALRSQNLTAELIQFLLLQKWNGVLPTVTGANPFVSVAQPPSGR